MANMDPGLLVTLTTIIVGGLGIVLGTAIPALAEGRAVVQALESMARQPEVAGDLRTTLLISMALLESTAIYVLLVMLVLVFANPLLDRFFGAG
jgi:F-type H+-transporting ATPase subunit c